MVRSLIVSHQVSDTCQSDTLKKADARYYWQKFNSNCNWHSFKTCHL